MKKWTKQRFPWIAILLLLPLTGCSTGNVVRRMMNVELLPTKIDINKGTVIEAVEMPPTTNQHPATRVLYLNDSLEIGCIEIPGGDLNKARKKIESLGTFTAKRRWSQSTLMGFGCPMVVSWKGTPDKMRAGRVDEDDWRDFIWLAVRRQILLLAPAQIRILGDLFWPKEFPSQLEGVFVPRQSTMSAPARPDAFEILRPARGPVPTAEDIPDAEMGLDDMSSKQLETWYDSLTPDEKREFKQMVGVSSSPASTRSGDTLRDADIVSLVARSTMARVTPASTGLEGEGFYPRIHLFKTVNADEIQKERE